MLKSANPQCSCKLSTEAGAFNYTRAIPAPIAQAPNYRGGSIGPTLHVPIRASVNITCKGPEWVYTGAGIATCGANGQFNIPLPTCTSARLSLSCFLFPLSRTYLLWRSGSPVCNPPCQHGGICFDPTPDNPSQHVKCLCTPGYAGRECQTDINECASFPCQVSWFVCVLLMDDRTGFWN